MHIRKCGISLCCCTLLSSTKLALLSPLNACYSQEYSAPSTLPLSVRNVFLYHWSHLYSISLQFTAGNILSLALLNSFSFLSAIPFQMLILLFSIVSGSWMQVVPKQLVALHLLQHFYTLCFYLIWQICFKDIKKMSLFVITYC